MSPKHSSLAYDETIKEFDEFENQFRPELKVLVKANYSATSHVVTAHQNEIVNIEGRITISF